MLNRQGEMKNAEVELRETIHELLNDNKKVPLKCFLHISMLVGLFILKSCQSIKGSVVLLSNLQRALPTFVAAMSVFVVIVITLKMVPITAWILSFSSRVRKVFQKRKTCSPLIYSHHSYALNTTL